MADLNPFAVGQDPGLTGIGGKAYMCTPADSDLNRPIRWFMVLGSAGNVSIRAAKDGTDNILGPIPVGIPIWSFCTRINASGTTASGILVGE